MNVNDDDAYMRRALRLAAKAAGRTSPNPLVGALVVRDGEIVGQGYHKAAGEPHAEVVALRAARDRARDATLYSTLEPCAHTGRTPPCVDAIREAGIRRVVAAMRDPDPRTDGRGFRLLRAADIEVTQGVLEDEAKRLNEGFISRLTRGRPFVLLKLATTIDGRVAFRAGVTSPGSPPSRRCIGSETATTRCSWGSGPSSPTTPRSPSARSRDATRSA
jgi:diaminohydroxyphosphoribosylaminopyrimidine deaminase/5-amino-6-(5-phosphoribosylamino)uracil reductase